MKTALLALLLMIPFTVAVSQTQARLARTPALNYDWRPGFVSITDLTGALGLASTSSDLSAYYYGITTSAGYQFTRNLKAAAGAGIHIHDEGVLFPLFADFRLSMNAQQVIPFISGTGGIMLDFDEIQATRVFINPALGLRIVAASRRAVTLGTGLMITTGGMHQRKSFVNFRLGVELKGRSR